MPASATESLSRALRAAEAAESKRAEDIVVLDLHGQTLVTDYFVICTGGSRVQIRAIVEGIHEALADYGRPPHPPASGGHPPANGYPAGPAGTWHPAGGTRSRVRRGAPTRPQAGARRVPGGSGAVREGDEAAQWVLLDFGDVVAHVFGPEARAYYRLERLWGNARPVVR